MEDYCENTIPRYNCKRSSEKTRAKANANSKINLLPDQDSFQSIMVVDVEEPASTLEEEL